MWFSWFKIIWSTSSILFKLPKYLNNLAGEFLVNFRWQIFIWMQSLQTPIAQKGGARNYESFILELNFNQ